MPFLPYDQDQMTFLPSALEELIPQNDLVRVINGFVDSLDRSIVEDLLMEETGRPMHHPRMMLKTILYAYSQRLYSCRLIAKAMRQNVFFMWLAAMQTPDFITVNRFRSVYLAKALEAAFPKLAELLLEKGYIRGQDYFVDGTKMEANASKHSHVWRKNVERYARATRQRALEILREADAINEREDREMGSRDLAERGDGVDLKAAEITRAAKSVGQEDKSAEEKTNAAEPMQNRAAAEGAQAACDQKGEPAKGAGADAASLKASEITAAAGRLAERARTTTDNVQNKALEKCSKTLGEQGKKLARYEEQMSTLGGRNSYSKTDPDATFMRMKNGELRGAYNLQIGTEEGFTLAYSLSQNANDASSFIAHMEERKKQGLKEPPQNVMADSAYGVEENYAYLEQEKIAGNYLKYPYWQKERDGSIGAFDKRSFRFDEASNCFTCPAGRSLVHIGDGVVEGKSGYKATVSHYKSQDCGGCTLREKCTGSDKTRSVQRSGVLEAGQAAARRNLETAKGQDLRSRRGWEVETRFAMLKQNLKLRRMNLRGLEKAKVDMGYALMAMNLVGLHARTQAEGSGRGKEMKAA